MYYHCSYHYNHNATQIIMCCWLFASGLVYCCIVFFVVFWFCSPLLQMQIVLNSCVHWFIVVLHPLPSPHPHLPTSCVCCERPYAWVFLTLQLCLSHLLRLLRAAHGIILGSVSVWVCGHLSLWAFKVKVIILPNSWVKIGQVRHMTDSYPHDNYDTQRCPSGDGVWSWIWSKVNSLVVFVLLL